MKPLKLTKNQSKKIILGSQLLSRYEPISGKKGILAVLNELGYVQIDTISVIKRAHHHTFWTRLPDYREEQLYELQFKDRSLFEYWGHAASFLPMKDYRFYLPKMIELRSKKTGWIADLSRKYKDFLPLVRNRIEKEGPLSSRDFQSPSEKKRGPWWDWKPAKAALEILYWQGYLMVSHRKGFQKIYDLTERILPGNIETRVPAPDDLAEFFVLRALRSYGVADESSLYRHLPLIEKKSFAAGLKNLVEKGVALRISLEEHPGQSYFALEEKVLKKSRSDPEMLHLLSPFDNLVVLRDRIEKLFDFKYTLECYLPAEKREFGYFVLPVLWKDSFIARIDVKADRNKGHFLVRIFFEDFFTDPEPVIQFLADKLAALASFNDCNHIEILYINRKISLYTLNKIMNSKLEGVTDVRY